MEPATALRGPRVARLVGSPLERGVRQHCSLVTHGHERQRARCCRNSAALARRACDNHGAPLSAAAASAAEARRCDGELRPQPPTMREVAVASGAARWRTVHQRWFEAQVLPAKRRWAWRMLREARRRWMSSGERGGSTAGPHNADAAASRGLPRRGCSIHADRRTFCWRTARRVSVLPNVRAEATPADGRLARAADDAPWRPRGQGGRPWGVASRARG
jgi:hypothetical protein